MLGILTICIILFIECHAFKSTDGMVYEEQTLPLSEWSLVQEFELGLLATKSLCGLVCNTKNCLAFRINSDRNSCEFGVVDPTWSVTLGDESANKIKVFYDPSQRGMHQIFGFHFSTDATLYTFQQCLFTVADFALVHGGQDPATAELLRGFDLFMPRFGVCQDDRLPTVTDSAAKRRYHALASVDGIVYMCGGEGEW